MRVRAGHICAMMYTFAGYVADSSARLRTPPWHDAFACLMNRLTHAG
jgi:hypothetical protein